jgi:hypothetical protein
MTTPDLHRLAAISGHPAARGVERAAPDGAATYPLQRARCAGGAREGTGRWPVTPRSRAP